MDNQHIHNLFHDIQANQTFVKIAGLNLFEINNLLTEIPIAWNSINTQNQP